LFQDIPIAPNGYINPTRTQKRVRVGLMRLVAGIQAALWLDTSQCWK